MVPRCQCGIQAIEGSLSFIHRARIFVIVECLLKRVIRQKVVLCWTCPDTYPYSTSELHDCRVYELCLLARMLGAVFDQHALRLIATFFRLSYVDSIVFGEHTFYLAIIVGAIRIWNPWPRCWIFLSFKTFGGKSETNINKILVACLISNSLDFWVQSCRIGGMRVLKKRK